MVINLLKTHTHAWQRCKKILRRIRLDRCVHLGVNWVSIGCQSVALGVRRFVWEGGIHAYVYGAWGEQGLEWCLVEEVLQLVSGRVIC